MSDIMDQVRRYRERVELRGSERSEDESDTQQAITLMENLRKASSAREAVAEIDEALDAVAVVRRTESTPDVDGMEETDEPMRRAAEARLREVVDDTEASVESIEENVETSKVRVDSEQLTSIVELLDSLNDTVPKAVETLSEVLASTGATLDPAEGFTRKPVDGSDGLAKALAFGDELPENLPAALLDYADQVRGFIEVFEPAALKGAEAAVSLPNGLNTSSTTSFWDSVDRELKRITDPRIAMSRSWGAMPNAAPLFHDESFGSVRSLQLAHVMEYVSYQAPATSFEIQSEFEGTDEACELQALTYTEIRLIVKALLDVLALVNINELKSKGLPIWRDLIQAETTCRRLIGSVSADLDATSLMVPKILGTAYRLSSVTIAQVLVSLVLTSHAVALYCQRSLNADLVQVEGNEEGVSASVATTATSEPEVDASVDTEDTTDQTTASGKDDESESDDAGEDDEITDADIDEALDPDTPPPPQDEPAVDETAGGDEGKSDASEGEPEVDESAEDEPEEGEESEGDEGGEDEESEEPEVDET